MGRCRVRIKRESRLFSGQVSKMSATAAVGQGSAQFSASISANMGMAAAEPCLSCVEDEACWRNPIARTAQNFISVCRLGHGVFFLAYALFMVVILILTWLTSNGSISPTVNAWVCTLIAAIVIVFLFLHWYLYLKGVLPECCSSEGCVNYEEAAGNGNFMAAGVISSGATTSTTVAA